jgi:hypothetical protein
MAAQRMNVNSINIALRAALYCHQVNLYPLTSLLLQVDFDILMLAFKEIFEASQSDMRLFILKLLRELDVYVSDPDSRARIYDFLLEKVETSAQDISLAIVDTLCQIHEARKNYRVLGEVALSTNIDVYTRHRIAKQLMRCHHGEIDNIIRELAKEEENPAFRETLQKWVEISKQRKRQATKYTISIIINKVRTVLQSRWVASLMLLITIILSSISVIIFCGTFDNLLVAILFFIVIVLALVIAIHIDFSDFMMESTRFLLSLMFLFLTLGCLVFSIYLNTRANAFYEQFDSYLSDDWTKPAKSSQAVAEVENGELIIEIESPGLMWWTTLQSHELTNFRLSVDCISLGPEEGMYGIMFDIVDDDNKYLLAIVNGKELQLLRQRSGQWESMLNPIPIEDVLLDSNSLELRVRARKIEGYVNGDCQIVLLLDEERQPGAVGLVVGAHEAPNVKVAFDNFSLMPSW